MRLLITSHVFQNYCFSTGRKIGPTELLIPQIGRETKGRMS